MDTNSSPKKLYRSQTDKKWLGVCGGLAEYFEIDAVLVRVLWVIITMLTGIIPGVLVYLLAALVMPKGPLRI
jgi:phage shock protein C